MAQAETMLGEFATQAGAGCAGSSRIARALRRQRPAALDAARIRSHPAAQYVNWVGRTVQQIREEAALHAALRERYLARHAATFTVSRPRSHPQMLARSRCVKRRTRR